MIVRARWLICLACLGCHAMPPAPPESVVDVSTAPSPALEFIRNAPTSPPLPAPAPNHLTLAAACLARGDEDLACGHLTQFVAQQPGHPNARFFLAELLLRRNQHSAARGHFEAIIAADQEEASGKMRQLLHCHGRLLAAAEALDDEYEIQLQRGISLTLLAQMRAEIGDLQGELPVEALLFRAAASLTAAYSLQPDQARPCWYLHTVWRQLAQARPAEMWLRKAQAAAPFSYLTAVEQRDLCLAVREAMPSALGGNRR